MRSTSRTGRTSTHRPVLPRMALYADYQGWQHKQFLGRGEFTLTFGDFKVAITAPADHIVAATGVAEPQPACSPPSALRLDRASRSDKPVMIVTPEALENEGGHRPERRPGCSGPTTCVTSPSPAPQVHLGRAGPARG